jgi:hypothetical protein
MTVQTGRTVPRFVKLQIEDIGGVLRDIEVRSFGDVGLTYEEVDVSAIIETVKKFLAGQATFSLQITAVWSTKAAVAASASTEASEDHATGAQVCIEPLNGDLTPRAFGIYFGVRHPWETGEPVFGANNSIAISDFKVQPDAGTCTFKMYHIAGGVAPDWGTAAIAVS